MATEKPACLSDRWTFVVPAKQTSYLVFNRVKALFYETLHSAVSRHRVKQCFSLLRLLGKDTSMDPYALVRFVLILIETNPTELVDKNVIIHSESLLSKMEVSRPDVFVEFLSYFIKNNRLDDARELFTQRQRFISRRIHRELPFVDCNFHCYEFLLHYYEWQEQFLDSKPVLDLSTQGWLVNAIQCLRNTDGNHEYFAILLVHILLSYGYNRKAYLFSSEFRERNPDNLGAQLLHLRLIDYVAEASQDRSFSDIEKLVENRSKDMLSINNFTQNIAEESVDHDRYPLIQDRESIMRNLKFLDPSRIELVEDARHHLGAVETLKTLMDSMEHSEGVCDLARWNQLMHLLLDMTSSRDTTVIAEAKKMWQQRYSMFWKPANMIKFAGDRIPAEGEALILEVCRLLNRLDS